MPKPTRSPRRGEPFRTIRVREAHRADRARLTAAAGTDNPVQVLAQAMIEALRARQVVTEEDMARLGFTAAEIRRHGRAAREIARDACPNLIREVA